MDFEFVRHEPLYDRILLVLTLDRQKMKERILIGEELQIRFRLQGYDDTEVLCDVTRPLGTMLSTFEHDSDGESVHMIFVGCSNAAVRFRSSSGKPPPRDCASRRASQMTGIVPKR